MKQRAYIFLIIATVISGILGGAIAGWFFMSRNATAEELNQYYEGIATERLLLIDANKRTRAMLVVGVDGNVSLNFYDRNNENRVALGVSPDGSPILRLAKGGAFELVDSGNQTRAKISLTADGHPSLRLYDEDGKSRAILGSVVLDTTETAATGSKEKRAESSLILSDASGKVLWSAPK